MNVLTICTISLLLLYSQIDLCYYMVNYPDLISLPVSTCPVPAASYTFNVKLLFNEIWLGVNGDMQVYSIRLE